MHLRLRRKRPHRPLPGAVRNPHQSRKLLIPRDIYQPNTPSPRTAFLAADVHLCSTENQGEKSAVQKKVLIVDDSPAQVKLIQGLLEPEGYPSVGLNDPRRIEETITAERPCMILLDVVMPERNGFQICRELKGSAEFNAIPVILVTSKDTASDRYWGEQQGADGYVTKPFTREELLRAVRRFA
jgi:twitching motility two-component system response regulator PilH